MLRPPLHHHLTVLLLAGTLPAAYAAPVAPPAAAAGREARAVRELLASDTRLRVPAAVRCAGRSLSAALAEMAREMGVPLSAALAVADQPAVILLSERPAWQALALLAEHQDYQWRRRGGGYELYQSPQARQREDEAAAALVAPQLGEIGQRLRDVSAVLRRSPEEREARQRELAVARAGASTENERARLFAEEHALADAGRPAASLAVGVYEALTLAQWRLLAQGESLHWSTRDGSLSADRAEQVHAVVSQLMRWELEAGSRQADLTVRLTDPPQPRVTPQLAAAVNLRFEVGMASGDRNKYRPFLWTPVFPRTNPILGAPTPTSDPRLLREITAVLVTRPEAQPPAALGGGWQSGLVPLAAVAEAVARETGLNLLADAPLRARVDPAAVWGRRTPASLLDALCLPLRMRWSVEDDVLRLWSETRPWDRPRQVPDRLLARWRAKVAGAPGFDAQAELAAGLDESQARGLFELWGWYFEGEPYATQEAAQRFFGFRHHYRFWASLQPRQRAAARELLPAQVMSAPQRIAFLRALTARDDRNFGPMRISPHTAPAAIRGFRVAGEEVHLHRLRLTFGARSMETVQETPPGRLPRAAALGGGPAPEPVGPPVPADRMTLEYYLIDRLAPALKAGITLPRPASPP